MKKYITISSRIDNLREIEKTIDAISAENQLGLEVYGNILIATLEAVNNAITHGNKLKEDKNVEVIFTIDNNKLIIITKDEGDGFDYENIPDPTEPENIENIDGRGIFLMNQLSDELIFHDEGRISEMIFNI